MLKINKQSFSTNKPLLKKGFTLIELLVVIAIIGLLATFIVASFGSAQAKGRDARRKSDLNAISTALELFRTDTSGAAKYPNTITGSLVANGYIRSLPTDPSSVAVNYVYTPFQKDGVTACAGGGDTPAAASAGNCQTFQVVTCIENNKDANADLYPAIVPCTAPGQAANQGARLSVKNP